MKMCVLSVNIAGRSEPDLHVCHTVDLCFSHRHLCHCHHCVYKSCQFGCFSRYSDYTVDCSVLLSCCSLYTVVSRFLSHVVPLDHGDFHFRQPSVRHQVCTVRP